MDVYGEILRGTALPRFFPLRQRFDRAEVPDAGEAVRRTLCEAGVLERLRPGDTVALTAGSRQIDRLPEILRALAEAVRSRGALPFLVPAMGSHGGATAEGQRALLARYGVTDWREKLANGFGMGNDDIMRLIMPAEVIREKGLAALAEEKESIYREIYAPEIVPMPGLTDLLQRLRDAGIRCAVGSSGYKPNVDFVLEKCRIEPYFDARISGDMVSRCKPDPEIYLTAAAALGLTAAECVVFEDAPAGIEAARRAGAGHIVALATTLDRAALAQTDADRVIDDFRDITDLDALLK